MFLNMILLSMLLAAEPSASPIPEAELRLCGLDQPDPDLLEMSFAVVFAMEFDEKGVPSQIKKLKGGSRQDGTAEACVATWRIQDSGRPTKAYASLSWRRGLLHRAYLSWEGARVGVIVDRPWAPVQVGPDPSR